MAKTNSSGIGLPSVLFIIFLVLKLTGLIHWSWWWVTSPLWIGMCLVFIIWIFALIIIASIDGFDKH